jgi:agmatinase
MRLQPPDAGFLGLQVETDLSRLEADVAVLGVGYGWPYPNPGATAGCAVAPAAVRRRSRRMSRFRDHWDFDIAAPMLPTAGRTLVDAGDVPGDAADGPGNAARIEAAVGEVLGRRALPICLGGDDSVPIPILRAFAGHGPLTVLQVDAHLDFRDEVDGITDGYSSPMRRATEMDHVARVVHVGLRGVGSARAADVDASRGSGNLLVSARDLHDRGVGWLLGQLGDGRIFVSFDCDGLDPATFPAVSAPSPGGLTFDEAADLLAGVGSRLAGAVFTEFVPALDVNELSALVVTRLVTRLIDAG